MLTMSLSEQVTSCSLAFNLFYWFYLMHHRCARKCLDLSFLRSIINNFLQILRQIKNVEKRRMHHRLHFFPREYLLNLAAFIVCTMISFHVRRQCSMFVQNVIYFRMNFNKPQKIIYFTMEGALSNFLKKLFQRSLTTCVATQFHVKTAKIYFM